MKHILLFLLLFSSVIYVQAQGGTSPDWANKSGAFGVGATTILNSYSTTGDNSTKWSASNLGVVIVGRYGISDVLFGQIGVGVRQEVSKFESKPWDSEVKTSGLVANIGLQGNIKPSFNNRLALGLIFGIDIFNGTATYDATGTPKHTEDVSQLFFNLGIRPEYHMSSFFGIIPVETSIFFDLSLFSTGSTTYDGEKENSVQIFGLGDSFGNAGFTFWFH